MIASNHSPKQKQAVVSEESVTHSQLAWRQLERLAAPRNVGQRLPNPQPVQVMARELQGAHPIWEVPHLQFVRQPKERTSHLLLGSKTVNDFFRQRVPDRHQ